MKAIIIDAYPESIKYTRKILAQYCPNVEVTATCADGWEGRNDILEHQPDVVFVDIEMPIMTGFEMLEALKDRNLQFFIVFITAYDRYADKASFYGANAYLLKPTDPMELVETVHKLEEVHAKQASSQNELPKISFDKLTITSPFGNRDIELKELVLMEADGNHIYIHLITGEVVETINTIRHFEDLLSDHTTFFRPHRLFIINLAYIKKYVSKNLSIMMCNNMKVPLARMRREPFMELLKSL